MKKLFLLLVLPFSLLLYSCSDKVDNSEVDKINSNLKSLEISISSIINNPIAMRVLKTEIQKEERDEVISLQQFSNLLDGKGINLEELMEKQLTESGYEDVDKTIGLLECITLNNTNYCPYIHVPFSDEVNWEKNPVITSTNTNYKMDSKWTGTDTESNTNIFIDEQLAIAKPIIRLSYFSTIENSRSGEESSSSSERWLPWRKCYCSRSTADTSDGNTAEGTIEINSNGTCNKTGADGDRCGYKCDRAGIDGKCDSGGACPSC